MTDICIPISHLDDNQIADVMISVGGENLKYSFRVEAFPWNSLASSADRIAVLKEMIERYDSSWELIQIYSPGPSSRNIHVLFRKKY
jgi:hypothetical protein